MSYQTARLTLDELLDKYRELSFEAGRIRGEISSVLRLATALGDMPELPPALPEVLPHEEAFPHVLETVDDAPPPALPSITTPERSKRTGRALKGRMLQVFEALRRADRTVAPRDLEGYALEIPPAMLAVYLGRLCEHGYAERVGHAQYALAREGPTP